jgi:hypothetical protein
MQSGGILSRMDLADQVRRVGRLIPGITDENARRFVSLSAFQLHIPERLFDRSIASSAFLCLSHEAEDASSSLANLLISQDREMAMAFRTLRDINSLELQDADWPEFEDLEQFRSLEHVIHPAYLKLCEAVLGPLLLPIAVRSRRLRGKSLEIGLLHQRVEEAERQSLTLQAYDRIVRNAIAHGKVHYSLESIAYVDSRQTRSLTAREAYRLFDDLSDVCNGLAFAYYHFWATHSDFLETHRVSPPLSVLVTELSVQTGSPSWVVRDALEFDPSNSERQLNVFVDTRFLDDLKIKYFTLFTASRAESLAPGFDSYLIRIARLGRVKGWAGFGGQALRAARLESGMDVTAAIRAVDHRGIIVFPPLGKGWLRVRKPFRLLGTIREIIRSNWRVAQRRKLVLDGWSVKVRRTTLHRQGIHVIVEAHVVLEKEQENSASQTAVELLMKNAWLILILVVLTARWRAKRLSLTPWLPLGLATIHFFTRDHRRRRLFGFGLGSTYLCRLTRKRLRRIRTVPLLTGLERWLGRIRIDWNSSSELFENREDSLAGS